MDDVGRAKCVAHASVCYTVLIVTEYFVNHLSSTLKSPQECTPALLAGAAAGLKMGGRLFIYGPFALSGLLAPESNVKFDQSLKARSNSLWGVKDVSFVADLADERGLDLTAMTAMPSNNFFVVFTKVLFLCT